jgi:hypothetical protein
MQVAQRIQTSELFLGQICFIILVNAAANGMKKLNCQNPCLRPARRGFAQAGKCQINAKWLNDANFPLFGFWALFELDSPLVYHFVRTLTFDISAIS